MSAEQSAIDAVSDLLAASATWAALTGAVIIEADSTLTPTTAYAIIDIEDGAEFALEGAATWLGSVSVRCDLLWPPETLTTQQSRERYAAIRRDIMSDAPASLVSVSGQAPIRLEESAARAGRWHSALVVTFTAIP